MGTVKKQKLNDNCYIAITEPPSYEEPLPYEDQDWYADHPGHDGDCSCHYCMNYYGVVQISWAQEKQEAEYFYTDPYPVITQNQFIVGSTCL